MTPTNLRLWLEDIDAKTPQLNKYDIIFIGPDGERLKKYGLNYLVRILFDDI